MVTLSRSTVTVVAMMTVAVMTPIGGDIILSYQNG